jgi:ABC-type multidrug transport system ATPase subunit/drug/metabolite transporter (DMT)-like permease
MSFLRPSASLAAAGTVVLWASAFPAISVAVPQLGPVGLAVARLVVASAALAAAAPFLGVRRPRSRDLPLIAGCGLAGMTAYQLLLNTGERVVPAGTASLLVATAPVYASLLAARFLGERLGRRWWAGSGVALAGTAIIAVSHGLGFGVAALVVLAAAVVQGIFHTAQKPLLARYTGFEVTVYAMWAGTLFVLPWAGSLLRALPHAGGPALASAVFLGVAPSAAGFMLWAYALSRMDVGRVTLSLYLVPAAAIVISLAWLAQIPGPVELAGGAVALCGVILASSGRGRCPPGGWSGRSRLGGHQRAGYRSGTSRNSRARVTTRTLISRRLVVVSPASPSAEDDRMYDPPALQASGLTKKFGGRTAIDNVSLTIPQGGAFGLAGPQGAGKTTLIRLLLGLTPASSGSVRVLGISVPAQRGLALAKVGAMVGEPRFHHYLTGRENLRVLAAAREPGADGRIESSLARVGLREWAGDRVASYPAALRQRLGVAACLLGDPELLILDEPAHGLDPAGILQFRRLLRSFTDEGRTVVLSTRRLDEAAHTCAAAAVLGQGRIVAQGPVGEIAGAAGAAAVGRAA